ncbi:hypothetical protein D3C72_1139620 [compost metagenome]
MTAFDGLGSLDFYHRLDVGFRPVTMHWRNRRFDRRPVYPSFARSITKLICPARVLGFNRIGKFSAGSALVSCDTEDLASDTACHVGCGAQGDVQQSGGAAYIDVTLLFGRSSGKHRFKGVITVLQPVLVLTAQFTGNAFGNGVFGRVYFVAEQLGDQNISGKTKSHFCRAHRCLNTQSQQLGLLLGQSIHEAL